MEPGALQLQFLFGPRTKARGATASRRAGEDAEWRQRAVEWCRRLGLRELEGRIVVRWNPRMRSTAGRATWPEGVIELNPALEKVGAQEVEIGEVRHAELRSGASSARRP